jgi:hypothetical protein
MLQPKIIDVAPLPNHMLMLRFETGETKLFDVAPYISGDWYGKLKDTAVFDSVHLRGNTIEWSGGQDIAPHELYYDSIRYDG